LDHTSNILEALVAISISPFLITGHKGFLYSISFGQWTDSP